VYEEGFAAVDAGIAMVALALGKGRRERALPSAAPPRSRWTATCASAPATSTPLFMAVAGAQRLADRLGAGVDAAALQP
jgi:hypothetical protein